MSFIAFAVKTEGFYWQMPAGKGCRLGLAAHRSNADSVKQARKTACRAYGKIVGVAKNKLKE